MKSERTIRSEILRLKKISGDNMRSISQRGEAYEAYHALRWVINDLDMRPSRLITTYGVER